VGDGASVPGADVLLEVTAALRRILHGEKSEVALQVVCGDGGKVDPVNRDIAFLWYELHEKRGWSADAVARRVSEVYGKLGERRLRAIFKRHGDPELWAANDAVREFFSSVAELVMP